MLCGGKHNNEEHRGTNLGVGTSCIHGRFVQGEIRCKILRLASGKVLVH